MAHFHTDFQSTQPLPRSEVTDILVVDDRSEIRTLIRAMVGNSYNIAEASNGVQAWELVQALRPRMVFLDVMLPGALNGFQVLSAIRQDSETAGTKVIMVTGRNQPNDLRNARMHDADGYLSKPFSLQDIQSAIQSSLR